VGSALNAIVQAIEITTVLSMDTTISDTTTSEKKQQTIYRDGSMANANHTPRAIVQPHILYIDLWLNTIDITKAGLIPQQYKDLAENIFEKADKVVHDAKSGEYYYIRGNDLLRVKE
jgi:hypothetical protein